MNHQDWPVLGSQPDKAIKHQQTNVSYRNIVSSGAHQQSAGQHEQVQPARSASPRRVPKPDHTPNTGVEEEDVWVVTLSVPKSLQQQLDILRKKHFPHGRTREPAHLTLFHALPGSLESDIHTDLKEVSERQAPFTVSAGRPWEMKRGVAINMMKGNKATKAIHEQLRDRFGDVLSRQDSQGVRPHWTIMNFENRDDKRRAALQEVTETSEQNMFAEGKATGLSLWKYDPNGWRFEKEFPFIG